jgi:hypothetical protein
MTSIPATSASAAYTGPNPEHCLQVANLDDERAGAESGTWIGNLPGSAESDSTAVVILSGPYASDAAASQYASSLNGVEISKAGGLFVATAALTSHLDIQVDAAAACMAAGS